MRKRLSCGMKWAAAVTVLMGFAAYGEDPEIIPTANAMARVTKRVAPEYPPAARQLNVSGQQEVSIVVSPQGDVDDVKVVRGNSMFTQASIAAVKQWKFSPLVKDGNPARFSSTIVINYSK